MCDAKAVNFFRPWNVAESSNGEAESSTAGNIQKRTSPVHIKEEDTNSVSSVATVEETNTESLSENEESAACITRRRLRRSESSAETSSRSDSVNSGEASGSSLDMLSSFVFNSPQVSNFPVASCTREGHQIPVEAPFPVTSGCPPSASYPAAYLQRMSFHQPNGFCPLNRSSVTMPMSVEPNVTQTSSTSTTGQPFYYEYPGLHSLPQGLYISSVEQAVSVIQRQDAVVKQLKKLRPKKFRCEHCDVAFSNNGQLKGHIRIHTGERPFKCDAEGCGKSFTRNEELTRHKRIHTGLRPHACVVCGKRFGRKDHLKKHTRTHENRDPYRVSAAALGMFALGHALPQGPPFPPYIYPM